MHAWMPVRICTRTGIYSVSVVSVVFTVSAVSAVSTVFDSLHICMLFSFCGSHCQFCSLCYKQSLCNRWQCSRSIEFTILLNSSTCKSPPCHAVATITGIVGIIRTNGVINIRVKSGTASGVCVMVHCGARRGSSSGHARQRVLLYGCRRWPRLQGIS